MAGISRGALYYICKGEKKRDLSAMRKMDEFYLDHPSKVWQTDISYIPMADGFIYLVAIIDVYSRAILAWKLAMMLDTSECIDVLRMAVAEHGAPELLMCDTCRASPCTCRCRRRRT